MEKLDVKVKYETFNGKEYITLESLEIPNLVSQGETYEEAYQELIGNYEALKEYYSKKGLYLPIIKKPNASGKFLLRMSKSIHEIIIEKAAEEEISLNTFINNAISFYVGYLHKENQITNNIVSRFVNYYEERSVGYAINV